MSIPIQVKGMSQMDTEQLLQEARLVKHLAGARFRIETASMLTERGVPSEEAYRIASDIWNQADSLFGVS